MIERAKNQDVASLVEFIRTEWKSDHVFVRSPSFFQYQYECENGDLNFFISRDPERNITGILGFMNYGSGPTGGDIFLSLWKVIATGDPTLGLKLLERLKSDLNPRGLYCTGINKKTIGIYKYLGYRTGTMQRYVLLNPANIDPQIIQTPEAIRVQELTVQDPPSALGSGRLTPSENSVCQFSELTDPTDILNLVAALSQNCHPNKSSRFFSKRFLIHPFYTYRFWKLEQQGSQLFLVTRELRALEKKALRLVDLQGDHSLLPNL